jgi:hypothetical protein
MLKLKPPEEVYVHGVLTPRPRVGFKNYEVGWSNWQIGLPREDRRCDVAYLKDVDFEAMLEEQRERIEEQWEKILEMAKEGGKRNIIEIGFLYGVKIKKKPKKTVEPEPILNRLDILEADMKGLSDMVEKQEKEPEPIELAETKEEYIQRNIGFSTAAVLNDQGWHEPCKTGWWGSTYDETEDEKTWEEKFKERFLSDFDENTVIAIVDCHI